MTNTARIDALESLYSQLPAIECQRKCQECCGPVIMTRLEARRLPELRFDKTPTMRGMIYVARTPKNLTCPILKDGACSAYDRRPAICRLWGLTEKLRCPFGCTPVPVWTEQQARDWLDAIAKAGY